MEKFKNWICTDGWKFIIVALLMSIGIPATITFVFYIMFKIYEWTGKDINALGFNNAVWLGFWGSYLSSVVTVIVLYITTKQTREIQDKLDAQSKLQLRLAYEPMLVFKAQANNGWRIGSNGATFTIQGPANIGRGYAKDITISLLKENVIVSKQHIPILAIDEEGNVEFDIRANNVRFNEDSYNIIIEYTDMLDYQYKTTYTIESRKYRIPRMLHQRL